MACGAGGMASRGSLRGARACQQRSNVPTHAVFCRIVCALFSVSPLYSAAAAHRVCMAFMRLLYRRAPFASLAGWTSLWRDARDSRGVRARV